MIDDDIAVAVAAEDLGRLLESVWAKLAAATRSAKEPMHIGTLASVEDGRPRARCVVVRGVDAVTRTLTCHTDARSPKVVQLERDAYAQWLFYDPTAKLQLRLDGTVEVHANDAIADTCWAKSRLSSLRCYLVTNAPGTRLEAPGSGLPPGFDTRVPDTGEASAGRGNFAALSTRVYRIDVLHLAARGHTRAQFDFGPNGDVDARWVVP